MCNLDIKFLMSIYIWPNEISSLKKGTSDVSEVYVGDSKIRPTWPKTIKLLWDWEDHFSEWYIIGSYNNITTTWTQWIFNWAQDFVSVWWDMICFDFDSEVSYLEISSTRQYSSKSRDRNKYPESDLYLWGSSWANTNPCYKINCFRNWSNWSCTDFYYIDASWNATLIFRYAYNQLILKLEIDNNNIVVRNYYNDNVETSFTNQLWWVYHIWLIMLWEVWYSNPAHCDRLVVNLA